MKIENYDDSYFDDVYNVVHATIGETYPKYYPQTAVDFFHSHHSKENMAAQLPNEITLVLFDDSDDNNNNTNKLIGVASLSKNEIKRFFILPEYQGRGYGKKLLHELEKKIDHEKYDTFILDASLGAVEFYRKNGYVYRDYKTIELPDHNYLCYLEMYKNINVTKINYDGKVFTSEQNSANGEVDSETVFYYRQDRDVVWAEYFGGSIKKGFLVGAVKDDGELEFNYQHINLNREIKTGKCYSVPKILEDGRVALGEKWEWTCGDRSKGESVIVEVVKK